jgi:protein ImuB
VELVGDDNLGSPLPVDSHRPDAFVLKPFAPPAEPPDVPVRGSSDALVLRRLRPPRPVQVETEGERPVRVCWGERFSPVLVSAGPWRVSGDWWDTQAWAHDEWDLLLGDRTLCRLAHDRLTDYWRLDGVYD